MNKLFKRFIALGLTMSLASIPTLSEVSKANEISRIQQEESLSLLTTGIDKAMQSVEMDKLLIEEYVHTILEQPDIVDLEVMEGLPKHWIGYT